MKISISRNGTEIGEWTEEEVQTLLDEGKILPTDYYWMQGMTEWQEIATSIKPPPPTSTLSSQPKVIQQVDTAEFEEKKPRGRYLWYLCYFIGFLFIKQLSSNPNVSGLTLLICLVILVVIAGIFNFLLKRFGIIVELIASICIIALMGFILYSYYTDDPLQDELIKSRDIQNKKGTVLLDDVTRFDGVSVSENHTYHYLYTVLGHDIPSPDEIKQVLIPTLKKGYSTDPQLQHFRDRGVTFEYDYRTEDGKSIAQITISPNDLK